ncbi:MAG: hypothetical protein KDE04_02330, partial [Anaerolineales bacterium]|nr:hypothetical protein [Anaerolineales bacterium]
LTDIVFYARYPDRQGKPIDPKTEKDVVATWRGILNSEVKPALAGPVPEGPAAETPVAAPVGAQPDAGALAPLLDQLKGQEPVKAIEDIVTSLTEIQANVDSPGADTSKWSKKLWEAIPDTSLHKLYKEGSDAQYDEMTALLGSARELVSGLTTAALQAIVPEISDTQTAQIIGYYHQQLNTLTPFFTQMANMNILHKGKSDAWRRTCNVTSLSMVLLSLGVGADAFNGDKDLLVKIANHLEPSINSWDNLMALRMPDFVQFVAVLTEYKDGPDEGFGTRVDAARDTVAPKVSTTLNIFTAIVKYFGVNRVHSGEIDSKGTAKRKNEDLPADKQLDPESFKTETFKADVMREVTPWINQGGQIVVNRPGHYLRLQSIDDSGVTLDDPGDEGKNYHVTWAESNSIGHFRSWQVFKKA